MRERYDDMLHKGQFADLANIQEKSFSGCWARATALLRMGRFAEAKSCANEIETNSSDLKIEYILLHADISQAGGKHSDALNTLMGFETPDDVPPDLKTKLNLKRGELLQIMQQDEAALTYFTHAYRTLKSEPPSHLKLAACEGLVIAARNLGLVVETERAEDLLLTVANSCANQCDDPLTIALAAEQLSHFGDLDDAEQHFVKAVSIANQRGWKWDEAHVRLVYGRCVEYAGDDDTAISQTKTAGQLFANIGALPSHLSSLDQLSTQLANSGQTDKAIEVINTVIERARDLNEIPMLMNSLAQATSLSFELGKVDAGLDYLAALMAESGKIGIKPPAMMALIAEAWRIASPAKMRSKLNLDAPPDDDDDYNL